MFFLKYEVGVKLAPPEKTTLKEPSLVRVEGNISFAVIPLSNTTQHSTLVPNHKLSGEVMTSKVLSKINVKIKFSYRQNKFLTSAFRRLL